jgi:hypothetical protein
MKPSVELLFGTILDTVGGNAHAVCPVRFPYFPAGQGTVEVAFGQYDPFKQSEHCDVPFSKAMVPVLQSEQALNPVRFPNFPAGQAVASPPVPIQ